VAKIYDRAFLDQPICYFAFFRIRTGNANPFM